MTDFDYCPRLREIITSGYANLPNGEKIPTGGTTSTPNNLRIIRHFILAEKPESTLEIGLAFGASALVFLSSMKEVRPTGFNHTAIDPFQTGHWKSAAIFNIKSVGLMDHFTHLEQDSALVLPELCKQERRYNIVYVDGSHIFENVFIDFYYYCCRLLVGDGLILFDDCTDRHIAKVIRFIDTNYSKYLRRECTKGLVPLSFKRRVGHAVGIRQLSVYRKIAEPPREWDVPFANF